jgi:hypothetical protein
VHKMPTAQQPDKDTLDTLANLVDLPEQGTVLTVTVHKVGSEHGTKGHKLIYDDDIKQVLIWTGFSHQALIARSNKILSFQLNKGRYIERLAQATLEEHEGTTIADVCHALQDVQGWFRRKLTGDVFTDDVFTDDFSPPSPGGIWSPLVINGVTVRGCTIYTGAARPEDPRAPVPGTVYVRGLKLGEKMVTPAPNGKWKADSKPKTLAKRIILESLPVGLYCQYRLEPSRMSGLAVAAEAVKLAKEQKIPIDPGALTSMFKVG